MINALGVLQRFGERIQRQHHHLFGSDFPKESQVIGHGNQATKVADAAVMKKPATTQARLFRSAKSSWFTDGVLMLSSLRISSAEALMAASVTKKPFEKRWLIELIAIDPRLLAGDGRKGAGRPRERRDDDENDRRVVNIVLLPAGMEKLASIRATISRQIQTQAEDLSLSEFRELHDSLESVVRILSSL